MTEQRVDYAVASSLLRRQGGDTDDLDSAIQAVPLGADAGAANSELAFVLTALLESAGVAADTLRVLYAVAEDAVADLATNDDEIADALFAFEAEVFGP